MKLSMFDTILSNYNFDNVDNLLSEIIEDSYVNRHHLSKSKFWKIDKENNQVNLFLTLPGFCKDDFDIIFDESYLTIKASQKEDKKYLTKVFDYCCKFKLLPNLDLENHGCQYQDGILNVWFKLKTPENPNKVERKIEIK